MISCPEDALGLGCRLLGVQKNIISTTPQIKIYSSTIEYQLSRVSPLLGCDSLDKPCTARGYVRDSLDNLHMDDGSQGLTDVSLAP